ncbi:MAG TPA: hypothetical protein H9844_06820 [Candidatus Evtepia faecigallinarum]|nr:hypothetical protein [Candidatus Evtepia faecigallinarum]
MSAGTWKRRLFALALLAALAGAYLGASALLEAYAGHTCDDASHCTVCQVLHGARQVLHSAGLAGAAVGLAAFLGRPARRERLLPVRRVPVCTLVALKVKMTD